jgi:hypothetical protein
LAETALTAPGTPVITGNLYQPEDHSILSAGPPSDVGGSERSTVNAEDDVAPISGPAPGTRPIGLGATAPIPSSEHPSYTGNLDPVGGRPTLVTDLSAQTPVQQQDAMYVVARDAPDVSAVSGYMEVTPGSHPAHTSSSSSDPSGGWERRSCPTLMEPPPDWHSEASSSSTASGGTALAPRTMLPGQGAGEGVTGVESGATAPGPPAHNPCPKSAACR